jgi:hypothetical protein
LRPSWDMESLIGLMSPWPFRPSHLSVTSSYTIQRISSKTDRDPMTGTPIHYFANTSGDMSMKQFQASSNASGIGDLVFRAKFGLKNWGEETRLAVATDIRVPTGDEYNYLGSGAFGLKPPRWSLQNRPMMVTSKPANGDDGGTRVSTPSLVSKSTNVSIHS